jgi:hypothetical protein
MLIGALKSILGTVSVIARTASVRAPPGKRRRNQGASTAATIH